MWPIFLLVVIILIAFCIFKTKKSTNQEGTKIPSFVKDNGEYYSYVLQPYTRHENGKLPSSWVLEKSFKIFDAPLAFNKLTYQIQKYLGINQSVWGLKKAGENYSWEYYFYYPNQNPRKRVNQLMPFFNQFSNEDINYPLEGKHNYFMWSIDIDPNQSEFGGIDLYMGREGFGRSFCWKPQSDQLEYKNTYQFFKHAKDDSRPEVISTFKKACEKELKKLPSKQILRDDLIKATQISYCLAKKPSTCCVYYSGIDVDTLIKWMTDFNYDSQLIKAIKGKKKDLAGLLFDVGYDFDSKTEKIGKSGIYSTF